jgi:hypothetical protein
MHRGFLMASYNLLLAVTGQIREFASCIDSQVGLVKTLISSAEEQNITVSVTVLLTSWDISFVKFPADYVSHISTVTYSEVHELLSKKFSTIANISVTLVPYFKSVKYVRSVVHQPCIDEFDQVSYLNDLAYNAMLLYEINNEIKFDYIIKIRPDHYLFPDGNINYSNLPNNSTVLASVNHAANENFLSIVSYSDYLEIFTRHSYYAYCAIFQSLTETATFVAPGLHQYVIPFLGKYNIQCVKNEMILTPIYIYRPILNKHKVTMLENPTSPTQLELHNLSIKWTNIMDESIRTPQTFDNAYWENLFTTVSIEYMHVLDWGEYVIEMAKR